MRRQLRCVRALSWHCWLQALCGHERAHADRSAARAGAGQAGAPASVGARARLTRRARRQVLLSQDAWEHLQGAMPAAGFPTIEQLGLFRLAAWPAPIWLYQARPRAPGRRRARRAGVPRRRPAPVVLDPPSAAPRRKCAARCSGRKRATRCGSGASRCLRGRGHECRRPPRCGRGRRAGAQQRALRRGRAGR